MRNQTGGRITVTYYTIYELKTNTSYNITVRATNAIGTTESNSIIFNVSTTYPSPLPSTLPCLTIKMDAKHSNTDNAIVIGVGGVALLLMLMLALLITVVAVMVLKRKCQADLSVSTQNRHVYNKCCNLISYYIFSFSKGKMFWIQILEKLQLLMGYTSRLLFGHNELLNMSHF